MCVTTEVEGRIDLYEGLRKPEDAAGDDAVARSLVEQGASQWLPNQRNRQVTYISRLQCVQAAVHRQVEALALLYPHHRLGLITFNHELALYGDGTRHTHTRHTHAHTAHTRSHDTRTRG